VLELARMEKGQHRAEPVVGDVRPIVAQVIESLRPHADAQGVELILEAPEGLPPAKVDRDALVQVLFNLVDNAVKFGRPQAGERARVRVTLEARGDGVVVHVLDEGPGVPKGQLPLIFDAFYRGERELTRTTKGTGIGLALVAGLVADMGGRVTARNREEGGLEVMVELAAG
jgi:signal transduction histidine kinase